MSGPTLAFSEELHAQKYRVAGETFRDAMSRVASALKDDKDHFHAFRDILLDMRFMPGGRVQTAMGTVKQVTPYNCFVSGTIEDSFTSGHGCIMSRASEAAETMRMGGGIGYDFSTLRPRGALIRKLQSSSSGPLAFMSIFNEIGLCVASSGHRRGAQMGVLRVDHPDIEEFIHAKQNASRLNGFNLSIAITDEFMRCVETGRAFALRFNGETYSEVDAQALWETIMRSTWDWAEPGVVFIDRINEYNNLRYCETIAATNPCGEQPLPPYGACLLGSFNLTRYIRAGVRTTWRNPALKVDVIDNAYTFDWKQLAEDIGPVVQAMDNVVDRATYPLFEQEKEAQSKRRMGLGVTGLANAGEALGLPYGSLGFIEFERQVLSLIAVESYRASIRLAASKGAFRLFSADQYCQSRFLDTLSTIDESLVPDIRRHGIRNSHLTSIAPTGTISMAADNCSSGIEPVFAYATDRLVNMPDGQRREELKDYGVRVFGIEGKRTADVAINEHLDVLITASNLVDSAVSKTCNVPPDMEWDQFKNVYTSAWRGGCKGVTTFNSGGKRMGILTAKDDAPAETVCYIDPVSGQKECA